MAERRYSDDEVQQILSQAAEAEAASPGAFPATSGMTLGEIERIASEAGLDPATVRSAALTMDATPKTLAQSSLFGFRSNASHTVSLPRLPDDVEWARIVSICRDTFEANGREEHAGVTRLWRNGNLRVSTQPTPGGGATLEMRTRRDGVLPGAAVAIFGVAAVDLMISFKAGTGAANGLLALAAVAVAVFTLARVRLTGWSKRRTLQFQALGQEAQRLTSGAPPNDSGA